MFENLYVAADLENKFFTIGWDYKFSIGIFYKNGSLEN